MVEIQNLSKRLGSKFTKTINSYLVLLINRLLEPKLEAVGYAEHITI